MAILNLTQHTASPEQGAVELAPEQRQQLVELLTFIKLPDRRELADRAARIAALAYEAGASSAMIGGAPYLMPLLEVALRAAGITPLYAFSQRESVEETLPDGSVRKMAVFRHLGYVKA
jgi:hypothetical protein